MSLFTVTSCSFGDASVTTAFGASRAARAQRVACRSLESTSSPANCSCSATSSPSSAAAAEAAAAAASGSLVGPLRWTTTGSGAGRSRIAWILARSSALASFSTATSAAARSRWAARTDSYCSAKLNCWRAWVTSWDSTRVSDPTSASADRSWARVAVLDSCRPSASSLLQVPVTSSSLSTTVLCFACQACASWRACSAAAWPAASAATAAERAALTWASSTALKDCRNTVPSAAATARST
mmetsp:Transcript_67694/g.155308  ORF Transcript_67694/g.155308 Transcript_67694/m.155308 type:complete len:241 (+) Transcript_67694:67-789(+)